MSWANKKVHTLGYWTCSSAVEAASNVGLVTVSRPWRFDLEDKWWSAIAKFVVFVFTLPFLLQCWPQSDDVYALKVLIKFQSSSTNFNWCWSAVVIELPSNRCAIHKVCEISVRNTLHQGAHHTFPKWSRRIASSLAILWVPVVYHHTNIREWLDA